MPTSKTGSKAAIKKQSVRKAVSKTAKKVVAPKKPTAKKKSSSANKKPQSLICADNERCFWTVDGQILNDLVALQNALERMDKEVFYSHVGPDKNDFATWVEQVLCDADCAADLKINSAKTTLARLYHRLGVEGPEVEDTTSLLLTLEDVEKNKLIDVIIGKPRRSSASQSSPGLYVRNKNDEQSYLADGVMDISAVKTDWIERTLFDIPAEAIKSVRIDHADGDTYTLFKSENGQEHFELQNLPLGKKLASELIINRFGSILQDMQISGARSQEKLEQQGNIINAQIVTFEGIIANITAFEIDDIPYASFEFRYDDSLLLQDEDKSKTEDVKAFIANLNARTLNWWFEIPGFKYDILKKRSNIVIRDSSSNFSKEDEE